jgi:hypothetical protein
MAPIPHSLGEAAWRLPVMAAGGLGGYLYGKKLEETDPLKLRRFSGVDWHAAKPLVSGDIEKSPVFQAALNRILERDPSLDPSLHEPAVKKYEEQQKAYEKDLPAWQRVVRERVPKEQTYIRKQTGAASKALMGAAAKPETSPLILHFAGPKPTDPVALADWTMRMNSAHSILSDLASLPPDQLSQFLSASSPGKAPPGTGDIWVRANRDLSLVLRTQKGVKGSTPGIERLRSVLESQTGTPLTTELGLADLPTEPTKPTDPVAARQGLATAQRVRSDLSGALRELGVTTPEEMAAIMAEKPSGLSPEQQAVRSRVESVLGPDAVPFLRSEIQTQIAKGKPPPGPLAELLPELKPYRVGGAVIGSLLGGALSGLPLGLRAVALKGRGGEAAARARAQMHKAIQEAEDEAAKRSRLLGRVR